MLEIQIVSNAGTIVWEHFEEVKANLETALTKYSNLVVTEEDIKGAKDDMANLNKLKKALDDERKRIKKTYLDPYNEFEAQVKELDNMISGARSVIDSQVKIFDEKEKAQKLENIQNYFAAKNFTLEPFESFYDPRWLNKTCSDKKWQDELEVAIAEYETDWKTLNTLAGDDVNKLVDLQSEYKKTRKVAQAIEYADYKAKAREAYLIAQEQKNVVEEPKMADTVKQTEQVNVSQEKTAPIQKNDEILVRRVEIHGTAQQIIMLGNFMNQNGIRFMKIED